MYEDPINVIRNWFVDAPTNIEQLNGSSPNQLWVIEQNGIPYVLRKCIRNHDEAWLIFQEKLTESLLKHEFPIQRILESFNGIGTIKSYGYYWKLRPYAKGRFHVMGSQEDESEVIKKCSSFTKLVIFQK